MDLEKYTPYGYFINFLLRSNRMTQTQLASHLRCAPEHLNMQMSGKRTPFPIEKLEMIKEIFKLDEENFEQLKYLAFVGRKKAEFEITEDEIWNKILFLLTYSTFSKESLEEIYKTIQANGSI